MMLNPRIGQRVQVKGYYSVVRFVPDMFRDEGVNLGVVLLVPDDGFLKFRITPDFRRAQQFFGDEVDCERLSLLRDGLCERLSAIAHELLTQRTLQTFISGHQNRIYMTDLRTCAVDDSAAAELSRLFARLVVPCNLRKVPI